MKTDIKPPPSEWHVTSKNTFLACHSKGGRFVASVLLLFLQTVLVLELLNTSAALSELLLSCKERMASGANVSSDFSLGGLRHECIAACASNFTFLVLRMDSLFHAFHLFLSSGHLPSLIASAAAHQNKTAARRSLYNISYKGWSNQPENAFFEKLFRELSQEIFRRCLGSFSGCFPGFCFGIFIALPAGPAPAVTRFSKKV